MSNNSSILNSNDSIASPSTETMAVFQLSNMVRLVLKKWWVFALVGLLAGLAGIWYAASQKIVYKSRLTFAIDNGSGEGGLSAALNLASQFGIGAGDSKSIFEGDNILEIMQSRRMVELVLLSVDTFDNKPYTLIEFYLYGIGGNKKLQEKGVHFLPGQDRRNFTYKQDSILKEVYLEFISEKISAQRPDRKLSIYEASITTENEKLSKVFTDKLIAETNNFYIEISSKKALQTLNVLEQRVAAMKGGLNSSISSRAASQDANLNPAFSSSQVPILKEQVNMQVYGGAYGEMFKNLEMARFQYLKQIPLMQIIDYADYPMKKVKVGKLITGIKFSILATLLALLILWVQQLLKPFLGAKASAKSST